MNGILVKGDRGLYISDGKKLYFPERSFKEAREGFIKDVVVVKDMGTYAFIKGEMVENCEMTDEALKRLVKLLYQEGVAFFTGNLKGVDYVLCRNQYYDKFFIGGKLFLELPRRVFEYCNVSRDMHYVDSKFVNEVVMEKWLESDSVSSTDSVYFFLTRILAEFSTFPTKEPITVIGDRIAVYRSRNAVFRLSQGKDSFNIKRLYFHCSKEGIDEIVNHLSETYPLKDYSYESIVDWAKEKNIALRNWGGSTDGLVLLSFNFGGEVHQMKMFGGMYLTEDCIKDTDTKNIVQNSVTRFADFLRMVGKNTKGKKSLDALSSLMQNVKSQRGY